jgi:protease-4
MSKLGVTDQTVVSGSMKDIASPLRTMTPAEREVLQRLIGDMQSRFVGLVRERRTHLTPDMDAKLVDGRVFSAEQAQAGGLVDDIGYLDGTIDRAKQRAGVRDATVIRYFRGSEFADSIYARSGGAGGATPQVNQINVLSLTRDGLPQGPSFLYLWAP